jgi:transcription termination factor Rho
MDTRKANMTESNAEGTLECLPKGHGFLRSAKGNYTAKRSDIYVPHNLIERYHLRGGEQITGSKKPGQQNKRKAPTSDRLDSIVSINDLTPEEYAQVTPFNELTVVDPDEHLKLETENGPMTTRVIDLLTPMGKGQRALIAAAPRTGKTMLLQHVAAALAKNHPKLYMMVLLIDERPEEVTEMRRTVHGEVVASSNDQDAASHIRLARLMIDKARRLVEAGQDVFILLDSLTRLGRAFNAGLRSSGRTMSGGIDINALEEPKAIFGAARNIEDGGSLTILATALIETGSRMDEVIFNEFKGTGNMEIMLTRELANQRIWPAMDLNQSGTRKEERLLGEKAVAKMYRVRRQIATMPNAKAMTALIDALKKYPNNQAFLDSISD